MVSNIKFGLVLPYGSWDKCLPASLASIKQQNVCCDITLFDASGDTRVTQAIKEAGLVYHSVNTGKDGGQAAAIYNGWKESQADILAWLNINDLFIGNALERVRDVFADFPELDVVYGRSLILNESGILYGKFPESDRPLADITRSNMISQPSCFVRRTAIEKVGGLNPNLEYTMDWDLWVRLYNAGYQFKFLDCFLSAVTWNKGSKTSRLSRLRRREINNILTYNKSMRKRFLAKIGFFLHYFSQYGFASFAFKALRIFQPRTNMILDPTHLQIFSEDILPIINPYSSPMCRLILKLRGANKELVVCNILGAHVKKNGSQHEFLFPYPVSPGETVNICFNYEGNAKISLLSATFFKT